MKNQIIGTINKRLNFPYVIYKGHIYLYKRLKLDILKLNYFFKENNINKILIKLSQGYEAYCLILASYLSNVCFCVIDEYSSKDREELYLKQYKPDVIFGLDTNKCFGENKMYSFLDITSTYNILKSNEICNENWYYGCNNLAYILYTSGSTGNPKGCRIKRNSLETFIDKVHNIFNLNENDIYGQYAPLFFDMSMLDVFLSVYVGATLVPFSSKIDKLRPGNLIKNSKITFINSVPQMIELLSRSKQLNIETLKSLRMIKLGGDKVRKDVMYDIFENTNIDTLFVTYGPTEATVFCMINIIDRNDYQKMEQNIVPLGKNIDGYSEIDIVDGEIVIYGECVADGYLDNNLGGFINVNNRIGYKTGDYVFKVNGDYLFAGRKDFQYKINGNRIDLSEIESLFSQYCSDVHVLCEKENIIVFVITEYDVEYLQKHVVSRLMDVLKPRIIIKLSEFPKLNNGKIDNKKLISIYGGKINENRE